MALIYTLVPLRAHIDHIDLALARSRRIVSSLSAPSTDRLPLSVVHHLEHDTPKCPAGAFEPPAAVGAALAAHETHGLAVPVLHEVETYAAGQAEGELWEGEESVAEVGGYFILLRQHQASQL